jgi:uncharacterized protein (TIGR00369 family)
MRTITNPWSGNEGYHCFGCCPDNRIGLKLQFYEDNDWICAKWQPTGEYIGYANVIHGGIQSLLHDEIGGWAIYTTAQTAGVTIELNVKYMRAAPSNKGTVTIKGRIAEIDHRVAKIQTQLIDSDGNVCSEGIVTYRIYPPQVAIEKLGYPGQEAFFK